MAIQIPPTEEETKTCLNGHQNTLIVEKIGDSYALTIKGDMDNNFIYIYPSQIKRLVKAIWGDLFDDE